MARIGGDIYAVNPVATHKHQSWDASRRKVGVRLFAGIFRAFRFVTFPRMCRNFIVPGKCSAQSTSELFMFIMVRYAPPD